jgi:hypothetical protein
MINVTIYRDTLYKKNVVQGKIMSALDSVLREPEMKVELDPTLNNYVTKVQTAHTTNE